MDRVELNVFGISRQEDDPDIFVLVLAEQQGKHRLPIRIGTFEAHAIAMGIEGWPISRPMTHDLCLRLAEQEGDSLVEVLISDCVEGVFYAELHLKTSSGLRKIDARCSDAIALAVRKPCPIFIAQALLHQIATIPPAKSRLPLLLENSSLAELERLLEEALATEAYERAQEIRLIIEQKKDQK